MSEETENDDENELAQLINRKVQETVDSVAVTPVAAASFNIPEDADPTIIDLESDLRVHGEVEIETEERGTVELHCGNTEFDYGLGQIRVDNREKVVTIPMDRVCGHERHYDL